MAEQKMLHPYPEYKDSGVEWINEIPAHWEVKPLFSVARTESIKNSDGSESNILSLSYGNIVRRNVEGNEGLLPESFNTYQIVYPDNIILRLTDLQNDKRSLRVGISTQKGIITSAYLKLVFESMCPKFAYRLLHSYDTTKVFYSMGSGLRQTLRYEDMKRLPLLFPPLPEQQKIADFLDYETEQMDRLIAKQERLIELLGEKRQAVISHAVTKGLNPDAPMKDSGIEWIGEIPAHWALVKFKHYCEVKDGTHDTPEYIDVGEDSIPFVTTKDIKKGNIDFTEAKHISKTVHELYSRRSNVEKFDVLMPMIGTVGEPAIVLTDQAFSIKNVALFKTSTNPTKAFHLYYLLGSQFVLTQLDTVKSGGVQAFVSLELLRNIFLLEVPHKEMGEIIQFLDTELTKMDALTAKAKQQIELLKERRTALISAAVTGKIDLRHWQPRVISQSSTP